LIDHCTVSVTVTVLGLPEMPLLAVSVIMLVYVPFFCKAEETVTVKVAVEPLAIDTGLLTETQPLPAESTDGVIVTFPEQLPVTLIVMSAVGGVGSEPLLAIKFSVPGDAAWSEQGTTGGVGC
jgi:hypothetical protein